MKRDNINYLAAGFVVLLALAALLVALFFITGRGGDAARYYVHYRNVTGLNYGAPVFYEGFRIGQVSGIEPDRSQETTRYKVELALREDWPIPDDSIARLVSSGLLADVSIGIREGVSKAALKPGMEIAGMESADLFAAMNDLAGELTILTRERIRPLIDTLAQRIDSVTGVLDQNAPEILQQANELMARLNRAASGLETILGPDNRAAITDVLKNARALTAELQTTRAHADTLLESLNATVAENRPDIRQTIVDLQHSVAAIAQRIETMAHHLESSSRNLDEFSREIRRNPNRLLFTPPADEVE